MCMLKGTISYIVCLATNLFNTYILLLLTNVIRKLVASIATDKSAVSNYIKSARIKMNLNFKTFQISGHKSGHL